MSHVTVISRTQKIVVDPGDSSVSVVNAGPVGPAGPTGVRNVQFVQATPPTALSVGDQWFNTNNGRQYVWYDGFWIEIGASFQANLLTVDGQILTRTAGALAPITRVNLALDTAFSSRYMTVVNHGGTPSAARTGTGPIHWIGSVNPTNATDNDALYRTDTTAFYKRIAGAWIEIGSSRYVSVGALGEVLSKELTGTNQTGISAITDITGMTANFTAVAGAVYKVLAYCWLASSVAGDYGSLSINVNGSVVGLPGQSVVAPTHYVSIVAISRVSGLAAGTRTVKLQAARVSGTGTITVGLTQGALFIVERIL